MRSNWVSHSIYDQNIPRESIANRAQIFSQTTESAVNFSSDLTHLNTCPQNFESVRRWQITARGHSLEDRLETTQTT